MITQEKRVQHRLFPHVISRVGRGLARRSGNDWAYFAWADARTDEFRIWWVSSSEGIISQRLEYTANLTHGRAGSAKGDVTAPVPGKIKRILVATGDKVEKNQTVVVLESMKMEFEVQAARTGVVAEVKGSEGAQVNADDLLIVWQE